MGVHIDGMEDGTEHNYSIVNEEICLQISSQHTGPFKVLQCDICD